MKRDIETYVKQCKICQVNKTLKPKTKAPMEIASTANHLFDKCYLDIVGPLPPSATGNRYILTFQDDLSWYVVATPISQQDAETVARVFVSQVVLKFGTPSIVQTDQGANFVSEVLKKHMQIVENKENSVYRIPPGITRKSRKKSSSTCRASPALRE
jgi:hypothetical protein